MLIIEIALGIVLAILIIANLSVILSFGLIAILGVIGIGSVVFIFVSLPEIVSGLWHFITVLPILLLVVVGLSIGVIGLTLIGAIFAEAGKKILGIDALTTTEFSDLLLAQKQGNKVLSKVALRYFAERMSIGVIHFLTLVVALSYLTDYLNNIVLATAIVVSIYVVIFATRKTYQKFKSTQK